MGDPDPGGKFSDISHLKEQFNQQQAQISALKEFVRKSDQDKSSTSAQERVNSIAQRLTQLKSKASKLKHEKSMESGDVMDVDNKPESSNEEIDNQFQSIPSTPNVRAKSETPGSKKIQLLRLQIEQNRQKMAEREQKKKEIEDMVTQLKAEFDITQMSLERSFELGKSMSDLTMISGKGGLTTKSTHDLHASTTNLDKERIRNLQRKIVDLEQKLKEKDQTEHTKKIMELEHKILDLEENLKEKECIIQARTQAVSLMSENLSLKGKNTVDLLEETKQEMFSMQNNFIQAENDYKSDIEILKIELDEKISVIENLEEKIKILENSRFELTMKNSELEKKLEDVQEYSTKLSELNKLNETLQHRVNDLESQRYEIITEEEISAAKHSEYTVEKKEISSNQSIDEFKKENDELKSKIESLMETIQEKTIEYNVLTANFNVLEEKLQHSAPKSLFSKSTNDENDLEISKLRQQLDESNKSSIKMKLKVKQLQKQIDNFKKSSDMHKEVIKLNEDNQILQQKIIELEEEIGQLQLKLVSQDNIDNSSQIPSDSDLENKIKILEHTCQNQTSAIQLLEEQKMDINLELNKLKDQVTESPQIPLTNSEFEGEELNDKISNLENLLEIKQKEIEKLTDEKNHYRSENLELINRIEKLSTEKVSSNESIEIVENLTQEEKQEIEEYEKLREKSKSAEDTPKKQIIINEHENLELSESLIKLREESSELMHKIEIFTTERNEILEKLEILTNENNLLKEKICEYENIEKIDKPEIIIKDFENKENYLSTLKNLKTEIKEMKKIKDKNLKSKMKKLITEAERTHDMLNSLINDYQQLVESTSSLKNDFKELNSKNKIQENLEIKLNNLQDEYNNLKINFDLVLVDLDKANQLVNEYEPKLKKLEESNDEYVNEIQSQKQEIDNLKELNEELYNSLKGTESKNNIQENLEIKFNNLQDEYNDLKIKFDLVEVDLDKANELVNEYEPKLKRIEKLNDQYINEIQSQKQEIENLNDSIKELKFKQKSYDEQMDILKTLVAEQKDQLITIYTEHEKEMEEKSNLIQNYENQLDQLNNQLHRESQTTDVTENLRIMLDKQEEELHYKQETIETLNNQITELYKTLENSQNQMIIRQDELQNELDEKNSEIVKLSKNLNENKNLINQLKDEIIKKNNEIEKLSKNSESDNKIIELKSKIEELESRSKDQLDKLKKFAANLKKKNAQCNELEEKLNKIDKQSSNELKSECDSLIEKLNQQIHLTNSLEHEKILLTEEINHLKIEINKTTNSLQQSQDNLKELQDLNIEINRLQTEVMAQNQLIQNLNQTLNEQNTTLDQQKNEINRRDKTLDLLEAEQEKFSIELKEKENLINDLNKKLKDFENINEDLKNKNIKIEKCKAIIKEKNKEIQRLNNLCENLNQKIQFLEDKEQDHSDKSNIERLNAKVQENLLYIETLETEKNELKEKICKLEDSMFNIDERRMSLERQASLLDNELQEKTIQFSQNEDLLVQRLTSLSQHDEIMETRLKEVQNENIELGDMLKEMKFEKEELNKKIQNLQNHINFLEEDKLNELERDNQSLNERIEHQQNELKRIQNEFEKKMHDKNIEFDDLEINYTETLQNLEKHKKEIEENLEKSRDECNELKDEIVRIKENLHNLEQNKNDLEREMTWIKLQNENLTHDQIELQELRLQMIQDQTEIENLKQQNQNILSNHEIEINHLKMQLADLDSMNLQVGQNQTDDQVMLHHENTKLRDLLVEKENEIENYQRKLSNLTNLNHSIDLQTTLNEKQNEIIKLQNELKEMKMNLIRQTSQAEIDCIVEYAQQALQKSPALKKINTEEYEKLIIETNNLKSHIKELEDQLSIKNKSNVENIPNQVVSFDSSMFFGQSNEPNPFDEPIQHKNSSNTIELEDKINKLIIERDSLTHELLQLNEINQNQINQYEILQKELNEIKSKPESNIKTSSEYIELQNKVQDLTSDHVDCVNRLHEIENENIQIKSKLNNLIIENQNLNKNLSDSENLNEINLKEIDKLKINIDLINKLCSHVQVEPENLIERILYLLDEHKSLNDEIKRLESINLDLNQQINNFMIEKEKSKNDENETKEIPTSIPLFNVASTFFDKSDETSSFFDLGIPNIEPEITKESITHTQAVPVKISMNESTNTEIDYDSIIKALEFERNELNNKIYVLQNKFDEINRTYENQIIFIENLKEENIELNIKITQLEQWLQQRNEEFDCYKKEHHKNQEIVNPIVNVSSFFQTSNELSPFDEALDQRDSIVEEIIVPKKTYVCGGVEQQTNDEGWGGWDSGDAILEEQHQKNTNILTETIPVPPSIQSQIEIQEYQDKIAELELQKTRLEDEVVALKVKSGKLLKKLKEIKNDNRLIKRSPSIESSNDLDQAIQDEMKNQISILENKTKTIKNDLEKCQLERDGLLKRVDTLTAANDRMIEMKDKQDNDIEMYLLKIKELNNKLEKLENWDDENYNKETPVKSYNPETTIKSDQNQEKIDKLLTEINDLKIDNEELQILLDEERNNNKINENKLSQLQIKISDLKSRIESLEDELRKSTHKIDEKIDENNNLRNEIERMKTASLFQSPEFTNITTNVNPFNTNTSNLDKIQELENEIQSLTGQLQYKNSEILHLNQKINDIIKEDQTQSLVQEILHKNQEINNLKNQVDCLNEERDELQNNLTLQITQEEIVNLKKEIDLKNQQIKEFEMEKLNMEKELKILNDQVIVSLEMEEKMKTIVLELDVKNIEILELKKTIESIRQQTGSGGSLQISDYNQDENDNRLIELENKWKQYVLERDTQYTNVIESLNREIDDLKIQLNGNSSNKNDDNKKLQEVLENQELEIVTLKEQLAIRSAEYARLAAQIDPFAQLSSSSSSSTKMITTQQQLNQSNETADKLNDLVPRNELDLALYLLHQRDMRCEELTLELGHLLEERDTLQLKLSNSIRQIEEIKRMSGPEYEDIETTTEHKVVEGSEQLPTVPFAKVIESPDLKIKLSELREVKQNRDKTIQEDRENRQRQMDLIQKDISNIPSEAVAQLVGADYTLSRTSQSPSSVLFNWLMGKSTPREPPQ